ncbi:MAG: signal peptidase I, partial [Rhizobacter sp.]
MPFLTAIILAAFAGYAGAWYLGFLEGNFALLLFMATVVTGLYWLAERFVFLPRRREAAQRLAAETATRREQLAKQGIASDNVDVTQGQARLLMQPWWLDWTAGLFPVIVVVFLLRSFLFEPFKIPSASMVPTLLVGDLILVNKFTYGLRLPVINTKLTRGTPLARGDVVVFRYPPKPSLDYIKRVVGLPGDRIAVRKGRIWLNGKIVPRSAEPPVRIPIDANAPCNPRDYPGGPVTLPSGEKVCELPAWRETLPNGATYTIVDYDEATYFNPLD